MRHVIVHPKFGVFMGLTADGRAHWTRVHGPQAERVVCWPTLHGARAFLALLGFERAGIHALPGYGDSVSRTDLCAAGLGDLVGLFGLDLANMPPEGWA